MRDRIRERKRLAGSELMRHERNRGLQEQSQMSNTVKKKLGPIKSELNERYSPYSPGAEHLKDLPEPHWET